MFKHGKNKQLKMLSMEKYVSTLPSNSFNGDEDEICSYYHIKTLNIHLKTSTAEIYSSGDSMPLISHENYGVSRFNQEKNKKCFRKRGSMISK